MIMNFISVKIESSDFWSHSWLHYGAEMIRERILKHIFDMHIIRRDDKQGVMSDMLMIPNEILEQFFVNKSTSSSTSSSTLSSSTATSTTDNISVDNVIDSNTNGSNDINHHDDDSDDDDVRLRLIPNPCGLLNHYDVYNNDWLLVGTGKPIECMRLIERVVWTSFIDSDSDSNGDSDGNGGDKMSSSKDIDGSSNNSDGNSNSDEYISNDNDGEIQYIDVSIDGGVFRSSSSSLLSKLPSIPSSSILLPSSSKSLSSSLSPSSQESDSTATSDQSLSSTTTTTTTTTSTINNNIILDSQHDNDNVDNTVDNKDDDDVYNNKDDLYAKLYEARRCRPGYSMRGPCPVDMIEHPSVKGHHFYAMSVYFYALHCIKYYSPIPLLHW